MKWLSAQNIIALSAVLVSVVALGIGVLQTQTLRKQQESMVLPMIFLLQSTGAEDSEVFRVRIKNAGNGPAIIKDYYFRYADGTLGKNYERYTREFFPRYKSDAINGSAYFIINLKEYVVASGQDVDVIRIAVDDGDLARDFAQSKLAEQYPFPALSICYCSIHDRCYVASAGLPKSVSRSINNCQSFEEIASTDFALRSEAVTATQ